MPTVRSPRWRRYGDNVLDGSEPPRPAKLVFLGGYSRNGSTVIGRTLGEADGAICVGETRYVWSRGLSHGVKCNCGHTFQSCEFWGEVGQEAFGGWANVDTHKLAQYESRLNRFIALPQHTLSFPPSFARMLADYVSHLNEMYEAIFRLSGAQVLIETSKHPSFAAALRRLPARPGRELRTIHLVRDSRAVAHSWTRRRALPSPIGEQQAMPRFNPTLSALRWLRWNLAFDAIERSDAHCVRLRYEDFVTSPEPWLQRLGDFVGANLTLPESRLSAGQVNLGDNHIFSGNPMRARSGWMPLRLDDAWRAELPRNPRLAVTALTWPLLRRYGYST